MQTAWRNYLSPTCPDTHLSRPGGHSAAPGHQDAGKCWLLPGECPVSEHLCSLIWHPFPGCLEKSSSSRKTLSKLRFLVTLSQSSPLLSGSSLYPVPDRISAHSIWLHTPQAAPPGSWARAVPPGRLPPACFPRGPVFHTCSSSRRSGCWASAAYRESRAVVPPSLQPQPARFHSAHRLGAGTRDDVTRAPHFHEARLQEHGGFGCGQLEV